MSLSLEQFMEASKEWDKMDERLNRLIGFNPSITNHYGIIILYNQRINSQTSDEKILEIRTKYLEWKENILKVFKNNNVPLDANQFNELFSIDCMYGTLYFLDIPVNIYEGIKPFLQKAQSYIDKIRKGDF